jgi:hypothetical protein
MGQWGDTQFVLVCMRFDFWPLHLLHAAIRLDGSAVPPALCGMMWSTVFASAPQ